MMCRIIICWMRLFFFFKQKTAYEMRISDWSSDVCSSDLFTTAYDKYAVAAFEMAAVDYLLKPFGRDRFEAALERALKAIGQSDVPALDRTREQIGRASCRERVCQYV